jgi:N-acyl-D-aspartate/D-glutamate deacylase
MIMDVPHLGWPEEISLLTRVAQASGRPVTFSLGCDNNGSDAWRTALSMVSDANRAGASLTAQVFPRPIGMVLGHALTVNPFCLCPTYRAMAGLPLEQLLSELRRPDVREKLLKEQPGDSTSVLSKIGRNFEWMFELSEPPNYEPSPESSIAAQARRRGIAPEALAYDLLLQEEGQSLLYVALTNFPDASLDAVHDLLRHEHTIVGLGDGGAHYGIVCDASFPTSMLAYWTRDRVGGRVSLAWAVNALSRQPAKLVGLNDRGLLAPGYKADINIIDYDRLTLHRPQVVYDLPAGGRRLDQVADGYDLTMVSGEVISRNNQPTGALPGRLVRGPQGVPKARTHS